MFRKLRKAFCYFLVSGCLISVSSAHAEEDALTYAKRRVEAAYAGTYGKISTTPRKAVPGKSVWIISPGQSGESAAIAVNGAKAAGEAMGWKMSIFDGKLDPSSFSTGVRQAIAAKADGIILYAIDCGWIRQPLFEARQNHIKTVAYNALDCDDPAVKGEALFDGMLNTSTYPDYAAVAREWGATKADWVIAKTNGQAKVIEFKEDEFLVVKYIREGFLRELAKCKTCEVVKTVDFTLADYGPKLQQKTQGALLQHPEANAIHIPYDSVMLNGVASAVVESGQASKTLVIAGEGFPTNIKLIKEKKGQDAANAFPAEWNGWAAADTLNSVFRGEKSQETGMGWQLVDREHNLPAGDTYNPPVDFKKAYKEAWGVH